MVELWNQENIKLLTERVKEKKVLHNETKRSEFNKREQEWERIAGRMGAGYTGDKCKLKFRSLKHKFYKDLRNETATPENQELLNFLVPTGMRTNNAGPARVSRRRSTTGTINSRRISGESRVSSASGASNMSSRRVHENGDELTRFFEWCEAETRLFHPHVQTDVKRTVSNIITQAAANRQA